MAPLLFVSVLLLVDTLPKSIRNNPYNPFPRSTASIDRSRSSVLILSLVLNHPTIDIGPVAKCRQWNGLGCKTVRYTFRPINNSYSDDWHIKKLPVLMAYVVEQTGLSKDEFEYMPSYRELRDHIIQYPNTTTNALIFDWFMFGRYEYTLMFNATFDPYVLISPARKPENRNELQIAVDQAIFRFHKDHWIHNGTTQITRPEDLNIKFRSKLYPQLGYKGGQKAIDENGPVFYYCGIMFQFVVLLYNVCSEKDLKLRQGLRLVGLKDSVYWLSWLITGFVVSLGAILVLMATGYAFSIEFFTQVNFAVNLLVFVVFSLSATSLAFFNSVFIKKAKSSLSAGMLHFILGLLLVSIIGKANIKNILRDPETVWPWVPQLLSVLFPAYNLGEAVCEISERVQKGLGFSFADLYHARQVKVVVNGTSVPPVLRFVDMPTTNDSLMLMLMNCVVFGVLALYLDQVLAGPNGEPRLWYEPFMPSFWGFGGGVGSAESEERETRRLLVTSFAQTHNNGSNPGSAEESQKKGADVLQEEETLRHELAGESTPSALQVLGLFKSFRQQSSKQLVHAVRDVWFSAAQDQILALLGHNGAGKTSTINILTGYTRPDGGDARIFGRSIQRDMDSLRPILGICPQHDGLWDELTPTEHLQIFSLVKGLSTTDSAHSHINQLLADVRLAHVAHSPVSSFSGGMKRRLSLSLAFLPCNKLVILDEPSTGVDPYVRRDLWDLMLRMKKGRVVVMTTHSMEEADALADKVVVMRGGGIEVVGTSVGLKARFGGYQILLEVDCGNFDEQRDQTEMDVGLIECKMTSAIENYIPDTRLISQSTKPSSKSNRTKSSIKTEASTMFLLYALPAHCDDELVHFLRAIEQPRDLDKENKVIDSERNRKESSCDNVLNRVRRCHLSQTTLEDVFMKVTQ